MDEKTWEEIFRMKQWLNDKLKEEVDTLHEFIMKKAEQQNTDDVCRLVEAQVRLCRDGMLSVLLLCSGRK